MRSALPFLPLTGALANPQLLSSLTSITNLLNGIGPAPISDPRFHNWAPATGSDVRSPCPGLNTLANHGFIHHDGRNMTIPHLIEGLAAGMNMGADFSVLIGGAGLLAGNPATGSFDLDQLDQHNFPIEHDASLSRRDFYFGNDYSFYQPNWDDVLAQFPTDMTALVPAANAINNRTERSEAINPTFVYGPREYVFRYGETAIYLQTMGGSDSAGVTRLDWVRELFEVERLPVALGWRPRAEPITIPSLGQMVVELTAVAPDKVPQAVTITTDSYKDAFFALVGGAAALDRITDGFASAVGLA